MIFLQFFPFLLTDVRERPEAFIGNPGNLGWFKLETFPHIFTGLMKFNCPEFPMMKLAEEKSWMESHLVSTSKP